MGLTHYWKRTKELQSDRFLATVKDCEKIQTVLNIPVAGWEGTGSPTFTENEILFNGIEGYS